MLTDVDFLRAATSIGCTVAAIKAVCEVESPKGGFNLDGSCVTLFEGHWFHKLTGGKYSALHPTISYRSWTKVHYGKNWVAEKGRLDRAMSLDRDAAIQSASWGRFQIMGFNYKRCGFATVEAFYAAMIKSEAEQLQAFVAFIKSQGLGDELANLDFDGFAYVYNGPAYKQNRYAEKMRAAHKKYAV